MQLQWVYEALFLSNLKPDKSFQGDYAPSFPSQRAWGRWSKQPNEDQVLRKKVLYLSFEDV